MKNDVVESDLEDNYETFALEYAGFRWDCEDTLSQAELMQLEKIRNLPGQDLATLDPAGLSDLERWVYATRMRDDLEAFATAVGLLLDAGTVAHHVALDHRAILAQCVFQFLLLGASDEALKFAQRFETEFPDDPRSARVQGWSCMRETPDQADGWFETWSKQDPEACFEIAEDWAMLKNTARALAWLEKTEALVAERRDHPVWLDCELLREALLNHER